jgi:[histone H3]-lysine4 N-trimethyltransferase SETD1
MRSPVHGWGMYAAAPIAANVFVIEYIGELLRRPLDDVREKVGAFEFRV